MSTTPVTPVTPASGFKSFLSHIGHFFLKIINFAAPIEAAATPYINMFAPGVGTAIQLGFNAVLAVEQKAAAQNLTGTGPQKLAEVTAIIGPAFEQLMAAENIKVNNVDITRVINAIVAVLNAIPAPSTAPAPVTPAAPAA
jgi:hypothetical protein